MVSELPGRDRHAVRVPAHPGAAHSTKERSVTVIGGGIAGLAAAFGLAERGVQVHLVEPAAELGGRVRSWRVDSPVGEVTMSRGFHAFFRQYYNLRALLSRAGDRGELLSPVADYPVVSASGDRDSFAKIPRTPPWNFMSFVMRSETFSLADLTRVDLDSALGLLDVDFPQTYRDYDGVSAAEFLDRLRFPHRARHLALEVFARSFFADPREFSAGELVAMFHSYFLGSAEGLLFDVPVDDFDRTLWAPLGEKLRALGTHLVTGEAVRIERGAHGSNAAGREWATSLADGSVLQSDAIVLAAGPAATRRLVSESPALGDTDWRARIAESRSAPPFAVWRIWTDRPVAPDRAPFLGTCGFGPLDNVTVLERYEAGARRWADEHGGSVIELHAYALADSDAASTDQAALRRTLRAELARVYPETHDMTVLHEELLIEQDCALVGTEPWDERPSVTTPDAGVKLAGDWVRSELPIALMERAATTGWIAANELLEQWGVAGHELWSAPTQARHNWPSALRKLTARKSTR